MGNVPVNGDEGDQLAQENENSENWIFDSEFEQSREDIFNPK